MKKQNKKNQNTIDDTGRKENKNLRLRKGDSNDIT